jgi:acetolactate synthase-1/2/3 large subunit
MLDNAKRPLLWLGNGIRLAGAVDLIEPLLAKYCVPVITSWNGKDMLDHAHPSFFGHAGVYGHRCANTIVQNADYILAIGTRLALPQTGFDLAKFAPVATICVVDIDRDEVEKFTGIKCDAGTFIRELLSGPSLVPRLDWLQQCCEWREQMPWLEPQHASTKKYFNSYSFMWELNKWLKSDQIIVTDMGTALLCAYPMLKLNGKQRLITSTGLGEMGFGLPAAVGASFAAGKREVLCLNCDGGMMFNLQELATIQHHNLPIKIIMFNNEGYSMIKRSQEGLNMKTTASGTTDMTFPDWDKVAESFGMGYGLISVKTKGWHQYLMETMMGHNGPYLMEVEIDPDQQFTPKVPTLKTENGTLYSPGLGEMV